MPKSTSDTRRRMTANGFEKSTVLNIALQALDHVPYGIVIITETMHGILHNETAENIFSDTDGITLSRGCLEFMDWGQKEFQRQIHEERLHQTDERDACVITFAVKRPSGRLAYHVQLRPLSPQSDNDISLHHGAWIVSIHDPEQRADLPYHMLRDYYHLTDAEIAVCQQLFTHGRIACVCTKLGLSRNTVKSHLTRIYSKCSVHSQAMLIMRLAFTSTR